MKKLNNKGFSLVELIIVIAIMAILVGVVGTQVIPYLENSRKAKDQQVISSWNTAAMSAYSNAAAKVDATANYTILIDKDGTDVLTVTSDKTGDTNGPTAIKNYFEELTNISTYDFSKMESKAGKAIDTVTITISKDGAIVTKTVCDPNTYKFDDIEN